MQINHAQKELTLKLVYYGPALSGKTTNLSVLHQRVAPAARGRLMTLDTRNDRTLFFDLLPIHFRSSGGYRIKLKVFTVPGQVIHASTRRLVLQGADAVAFIADAQKRATPTNNEAWRNLIADLNANNLSPTETPVVIQFNKMDLPGVRSRAELEEVARKGREPVHASVAIRGEGVVETLHSLLALTWRDLDRRYRLASILKTNEEDFLAQLFSNIDVRGSALQLPSQGAGT